MVGAAFPSNGYMAGCTVAPEVLGFLRCTGMQGDFGGTAIADSRSGELIFGGSTIWMGTGSLLLPTPAQMGLASDLLLTGIIPGYVNTSVVETNGLEPTSGGQLALNQALASVLVAGWIGQDDVDAYVWLQAYTLGMYVPENADWIVLLVKDSSASSSPSN